MIIYSSNEKHINNCYICLCKYGLIYRLFSINNNVYCIDLDRICIGCFKYVSKHAIDTVGFMNQDKFVRMNGKPFYT